LLGLSVYSSAIASGYNPHPDYVLNPVFASRPTQC
jgi:hypothetical protein